MNEGVQEVVSGMTFSSEQITAITTALTSAGNNVISMFVSILPILALLAGLVFGVRLVKRQFTKVERIR